MQCPSFCVHGGNCENFCKNWNQQHLTFQPISLLRAFFSAEQLFDGETTRNVLTGNF